jgi:uncharacterized membrane-anchored protein
MHASREDIIPPKHQELLEGGTQHTTKMKIFHKTKEKMELDTTEGEERKEQSSVERFPRLHAWAALTVSSIVCLITAARTKQSGSQLWVLIVSCISTTLSFLMLAAYCIRRAADKIVDKITVGIAALVVLLVWVGRFFNAKVMPQPAHAYPMFCVLPTTSWPV